MPGPVGDAACQGARDAALLAMLLELQKIVCFAIKCAEEG